MILLLLSIAILALSPIIYRLCLKREAMLRGLDGFIFVSMAGLILGEVLPSTLEAGGGMSLLFAVLGFLGPTLLERSFQRAGREAHLAALLLGLLGLCLHGATDGVCLGDPPSFGAGDSHRLHHLPHAVVLHRLPAGLTIWWLVTKSYGTVVASIALGLAALSTVVGYWVGPDFLGAFDGQGMAWFQALVAGSLLHVVHHRPHVEAHVCSSGRGKATGGLHEGIGGLVGILLLAVLTTHAEGAATGTETLPPPSASSEARITEEPAPRVIPEELELPSGDARFREQTAHRFTESLLALALEAAPALLLGYLMAGLLGTFLPASSIRWLARGARWNQAVRGVTLGLPIPVCSCGVVPLYRSLIQRGAPPSAALAFLVATPELGVDAVILSIPLLGVPFTALRVAAAAIVALMTGWLVGHMARNVESPSPAAGTDDDSAVSATSRLKSALALGFGEVVDHTGPWILFGLIVAAAAEGVMDGNRLTTLDPRLQVLMFALLGVPVYVCASGATPLVAVLLAGGVSPGAALAFLLTGPATNVTTFGVLSRLHGWRTAAAFSGVMILLPVGLGIATNELLGALIPAPGGVPPAETSSPLESISLVLLAMVLLVSFVRRGPRQFAAEILNPHRAG